MVGLSARSLSRSLSLQTPQRAWDKYCTALERQPLAVKAATAALGFTIGDVIAQFATKPPKGISLRFDTFRTARLALYGGAIGGPIGHYWYSYLDRVILPHKAKSAAAITSKIVLDQAILAPLGTILFFTVTKLLDGFQTEAVIPTIKEKIGPTMEANYKLWPLAHLVNFAFVPSSQRILYTNVVAIAWTFILSQAAANTGEGTEVAASTAQPLPNRLAEGEEPATASLELLEEIHHEAGLHPNKLAGSGRA